jgi:hypothetical protein
LYAQNEFSFEKFAFRYGQMQALQNLEDSILDARKNKVLQDSVVKKT